MKRIKKDRTRVQSDESDDGFLSEESLDWEEDNNQAQMQASSADEAKSSADENHSALHG